MAKGSGTTKYSGSGTTSASRSTTLNTSSSPLQALFTNSDFSGSQGNYELKPNSNQYMTIKENDKDYTVDIGSNGYSRRTYFTKEEMSTVAQKLSSMLSSERAIAIDSFIRDVFNPKIAQTEADAYKLRKKYFGA